MTAYFAFKQLNKSFEKNHFREQSNKSLLLIKCNLINMGIKIAFKMMDIYKSYSWHKSVWIWSWRQIDGHDISGVSVEALQQLTRLDVPESAGCVAGTGQHLIVGAGKKAARHVACVRADSPLLGRHVLLQG